MGIFDFIFRGPELSRFDAYMICQKIAFMLHREELSVRDLVRDFENILENIFQSDHPNNSIKPEQSRQIFGYSIYIYENHKDYLSDIGSRRLFDERGNRLYLQYPSPKNPPNYYDALHLFKDK